MSADRVIPARAVDYDSLEAFPYFAAEFSPLPAAEEGAGDEPMSAGLTSPEEDARRLASVDQVIYQKLQQAERDAQEVARKAYEQGYATGEAEGRVFGESQYKAQIQRLDGALQQLTGSLAMVGKASQDELVALALAVGTYLAGREIQFGVQTIAPLLEELLQNHPFPEGHGTDAGQPGLTVLLNPKDLEELGEAARAHPGVTLREDENLSRGSLRLESPKGVLDATLERRQNRLLELIQKTREQEAS